MTLRIAWPLLAMFATFPDAGQLRVHDKKESKQLLRAAVDRLARVRRSHPAVHRLVVDPATGAHVPLNKIWEDPDSPLHGQVCTLRVRLEAVRLRDEHDGSGRPLDSAADRAASGPYVLDCSVKAIFDGLLELKDTYPDEAEDVSVASSRVQELNDEIKQIKREKKRQRKKRHAPGSLLGVGGRGPVTLSGPLVTRRYAPRFSPSYLRHPGRGPRIDIVPRTGEGSPGRSPDCTRPPGTRALPDGALVGQEYAEERGSGYRRREREAKQEREELRDRRSSILRGYRDELAHARHELSLSVPRGFELPEKPPKTLDVVALVDWVGWDHAADLPTLIIKGKLLSSDRLGLSPDSDLTPPTRGLPETPPQ